MSSDIADPAIRVIALSKNYVLRHRGAETTLVDTIRAAVRHGGRSSRETFRALDQVSLDIAQGDVVGVIGRNGAGKSTLLKVLSRITTPSSGRVEIRGRVGSLLEVGTGFHPELTGRENIFLNGSLLGMSNARVRAQFDQIVDFAGTERFLDTPVKRYSSGMYVRLAFAVAAHLDVDVLLVDEVLAVGDTEFQQKCLGRMQAISRSGRTVVFVSHQMQSVLDLCSSAALLEMGRVVQQGAVADVVGTYLNSFAVRGVLDADEARPGTGEVRISTAAFDKAAYGPGEDIRMRLAFETHAPLVGKFFVSIALHDNAGNHVTQCESRAVGKWFDSTSAGTSLIFRTPWLKPGRYRASINLARFGPLIDVAESALAFEVQPLSPYPSAVPEDALKYGLVFSDFDFVEESG